ncbi:TPA: hypothetical protein U8203_003892 [Pseudomonas putida]|nr:hypothetical protein [Pseudomonas putida]HEN8718544.1 hypothetical protein [Pseudomonas putida]
MTEKLSYDREVITQTITSTAVLSGIAFATVQADYNLSSSDFLRLKDDRNWLHAWSLNGLFVLIGYFVSIAPKLVAQLTGGSESIAKNEWIVLGSGLLLCLIFRLLSKAYPSERKKVMKSIDEHFQMMPKTRQQIEGGK